MKVVALGDSLRARLLAFLLAAIFLAALLQGAVAYHGALRQADEVFDYQLERTALSLSAGNPIFNAGPMGDPREGAAGDLIIQVWTLDGIRLFRSTPQRPLPDRTVLGFSTLKAQGSTYRVFSLQTPLQVIQVAQDMAVRTGMARTLAVRAVWPIAAMAPLLMLVVWWVISHSLRPVDRARRQLAARRPDDLSPVSEQGLPDEMRPMVHELNLLLERVRSAFAVQQRFVSDAAHELRSPLTALKLQIQSLQRAADDDTRRVASERLAAGIDRAVVLVGQLLDLARQEAGQEGPAPVGLPLSAIVNQSLADVLAQAQARQIDIGVVRSDDAQVTGHADALAVMVRNLLDNAVKYSPPGGKVDIEIHAGARGAALIVDDSGPGIPAAERQRVFDRFYRGGGTTAPGSGLGLAIAQTIADRYGARILLDQAPALQGLRVTVRFPPFVPS